MTAALCLAFLIAATAVVGITSRHPEPSTRVLASAVKAPVSVPALPSGRVAAARWSGPSPASTDCPQMTNPGGRLQSSAAGPNPTDGTVSIPGLAVHAPIVRVGFDASGMVLPTNARDVAWLDQGPLPGVTNNVVLAGHISWSGVPGSLGGIEQLKPGDVVSISMSGGTWRYAVRFSCLFPFNSPRGSQVIGYTDVPSLTMVSCAGTWDAAAGTHNLRIVVRAEQIYPPVPSSMSPAASSSRARATPAPTRTPSGPLPGIGALQHP